MKVLITGANGFLSGHLIKELVDCGYSVRAMMRSGAKAPAITGLNVEVFYGNITNKSDIEKAVSGCDVVIHAAADTSQSHLTIEDYYPANVDATVNIVNSMFTNKCKRLIFVSSANTIGFGTLLKPGNESTPISQLFLKSGYAKSKLIAQNLVLDAIKNKIIDGVIVNPTFMIGPMDYNPHSGRIFKMILNKRIAFYPPGGKNFVDVRIAAKGIVNAITKGKSGECYLISGENISFRDFFHMTRKISKQKTKLIAVPGLLLKIFGVIGSGLRSLGVKTELNYTNANILCINNYYENKKAIDFLELYCTKINNTISDYLNWLGNKMISN
jgi:dihydroflavonol-4-reductase